SGVTEIERERGLRIAPAVHLDAGGGSAGRIATIGADDQPRDNAVPVRHRDGHTLLSEFDRMRIIIDPGKMSERAPARGQRGDQMSIFDNPAECFQTDLASGELDLRRSPQPSRVINDPQGPKRRRTRTAPLPNADGVKRGDGADKQRGRSVVGRTRSAGYERG